MQMMETCPQAIAVKPEWVKDSIEKNALLSERPYFMK